MKDYKLFTAKILVLSIFIAVLFIMTSHAGTTEKQIYNRNEKVVLSQPIIEDNNDLYISLNDLEKINLEYTFVRNEQGFKFEIFSNDAYGKENMLSISAVSDKLIFWDESVGNFTTINSYNFSNTVNSKKFIRTQQDSMYVTNVDIGDFTSVVVCNEEYYISIKAVATAISYEYTVNENEIRLWITNSNYKVMNGTVSLPDGAVAPENGTDVNIMFQTNKKSAENTPIIKTVCIPQGQNNIWYFEEIPISKKSGDMIEAMFEFSGDYKTVNEVFFAKKTYLLNAKTSPTEKVKFKTNLYMPFGLSAEDDIYCTIIFDRCAVYRSTEPIIKKGETKGIITIDIDKEFYGKVIFSDISGDERIFPYGYYDMTEFRIIPDMASKVSARNAKINVTFMQCYEISGQIIPYDTNYGYEDRIFGITDYEDKIYLSCAADKDYAFKIKVPCSLYEYNLSVCYKPGAHCNYISDGVSAYSGKAHVFDNVCDYEQIKLKYEPFTMKMPIDMKVYEKTGIVELRNITDENVKNLSLSCACFTNNKLQYFGYILIDELKAYSDYEYCKFEYPTEFYKIDEVKFYVWSSELNPLNQGIAKAVNQTDIPEEAMNFADINETYEYYTAVENMYCSGIMCGYEDGTFKPNNEIQRNEAAVFFCKLMGYVYDRYDFSCDDIEKSDWESSYAGICVNEKIFELENNKFRPYDKLKVNELYRAVQNLLESDKQKADFNELSEKITDGDAERNISRGEFAQMLYNYKCVSEKINN